MRGLLLAALVEVGLITWRDLSKDAGILPLPSDYIAVAGFYGGLALFPASSAGFVNVLGWGMVVATFLGMFDPANPTKLVFPGGPAGSQLAVKNTNPAANPQAQNQAAPVYSPGLGGAIHP